MDVKVAKSAGFCFGVKRAVDLVYEQACIPGALYTYGPIIHNEEVVHDLERKGVQVIYSTDELERLEKGRVIIRSHGVGQETQLRLEAAGFEVITKDWIDRDCCGWKQPDLKCWMQPVHL